MYRLPLAGYSTSSSSYDYFGGKMIRNAQGWVNPDRLGSIGQYFSYGQQRPSATAEGTEKFATYFRDENTGLDYAQNRYHKPGEGRFMSPDPYLASGGPGDPGSWNRYAYVGGDPVNFNDPSGLDPWDPQSAQCMEFAWACAVAQENSNGLGRAQDVLAATMYGAIPTTPTIAPGAPKPTGPTPPLQTSGRHGFWGRVLTPFTFVVGLVRTVTSTPVPSSTIGIPNPLMSVLSGFVVGWWLGEITAGPRGHADPIVLTPVDGTYDEDGGCDPAARPPQYKWQAINQTGLMAGQLHWHWIKYDLNMEECRRYPKRYEGPTDPGSDYILIPGIW
jgi:RHS repeat-associated protein